MKKNGICLFGDIVAFAALIDILFSSRLAMLKRDEVKVALQLPKRAILLPACPQKNEKSDAVVAHALYIDCTFRILLHFPYPAYHRPIESRKTLMALVTVVRSGRGVAKSR